MIANQAEIKTTFCNQIWYQGDDVDWKLIEIGRLNKKLWIT